MHPPRPLLLFALSAILALPISSRGELRSEPRKHLSVYFPDYRYSKGIEPDFYGTTDLILFSSKPEESGEVDFSRITPGLLEVGKKAQTDHGIRVTFCVGGWGRGKLFANAVSTQENRTRFVKALGDFCDTHNLDGVDIDWEFPSGDEEHADLRAFLEELSARLRPQKRQLTIALGYTRPLPKESYEHVDQVNLMSYQPWDPPKETHEAWLEAAVKKMLDSGLPAAKLNLGVGFFAKELGGKRRAVQYKKLSSDPDKKLPESEHPFSPVGQDSCAMRLDLVKKYQLGGVMVWEYGQDAAAPDQSLLRYLSRGLGTGK